MLTGDYTCALLGLGVAAAAAAFNLRARRRSTYMHHICGNLSAPATMVGNCIA